MNYPRTSFDWLIHNLQRAWRHRGGSGDALKRLAWIYADKIPSGFRPAEWEIAFNYPAPIGALRLLARANNNSDAFIFSEVFEHRVYEIDLAAAPRTVLDLGGNAGYGTLYFAKRWPDARLAVVEPIAANLRVLRRNLELNGIAAEVIEGAIGVEDGSVLMELDSMDYGHRVIEEREGGPQRVVRVPSLTIRSVLQRLRWERIGLLKIDIEGYETQLLGEQADWLWQVDAISVEWHHPGADETLRRLAKKYGFLGPECKAGIWTLSRPS